MATAKKTAQPAKKAAKPAAPRVPAEPEYVAVGQVPKIGGGVAFPGDTLEAGQIPDLEWRLAAGLIRREK